MSRRTQLARDSLPPPAVRWIAVFCAVMVWVLGVLAASPDLHALIHPDAGHEGHVCAVTLFSQGLENSAAGAVLLVVPSLLVVAAVAPVEPVRVESVKDWLLPGRGPPAS